jgi:hypothetical protein
MAAEIRDPPQLKWLALKGDGKIVMQTFTPSPDFAVLRRQLYYCDAVEGSRQASPDCSGAVLRIGYLITGWENLAPGFHRVDSVLMVLPDGAEAATVTRELTTQPQVSVHPARPLADHAQRIVPSWRSSGMISRSKRRVSS